MASEEEVTRVKDRHSLKLLDQPGVSGVGVEQDDTGGFVLTIHLDTDDPDVRKRLPNQIDGYPVKFVHSGPFYKLPAKSKE